MDDRLSLWPPTGYRRALPSLVWRSAAVRFGGTLLLPAALGLSIGCQERPPIAEGPNLVLVVVDTMRRDYGPGAASPGREVAAPVLESLAREGTLFTQAWANAPWTLPSHGSLFTGRLPSEHGCTSRTLRLDDAVPTLAEQLAAVGYDTVALYANPLLHRKVSGLLRGFAEERPGFDPEGSVPLLEIGEQGGELVVGHWERWLERRSSRRPFFAYLNLLEPHLPYDPPAAVRRAFLPAADARAQVSVDWGHRFNAGLLPPAEVDWGQVRRLYGADVRTADGYLGRILDALAAAVDVDRSVIVVTSDHGENLGEHGFIEHQFCVCETLLAIPLVVHAPGLLEPGLREDPVMLSDLYWTLLDVAGVPHEPSGGASPGHSLIAGPAPVDRPLVAEYAGVTASHLDHLRALNPAIDRERLGAAFATVRVGPLRLTLGSDGSIALHDLERDPGQLTNLAGEKPGAVRELEAHLRPPGPAAAGADSSRSPIEGELGERLRALGYLQ